MTFIFDLDDTLLDTKSLKMMIFDMMQKAGATKEEVEKHYVYYIGKETYNPELHITAIAKENTGVNLENFIENYNAIEYKQFLLPESLNILREARSMGNIILLTKGNYSFQARKILKSEIDDFFDDIVITNNNKEKMIQDLNLNSNNVVVINDKKTENQAMAQVLPQWKYIDAEDLVNEWPKIKSELV